MNFKLLIFLSFFICLKAFVLRAQVQTNKFNALSDTLTAGDWATCMQAVKESKYDTAYLVIGKKFISGKHKLSFQEWSSQFEQLYDIYNNTNHYYQFAPFIRMVSASVDSIQDVQRRLSILNILVKDAITHVNWAAAYIYQSRSDSIRYSLLRDEQHRTHATIRDSLQAMQQSIQERNAQIKKAQYEKQNLKYILIGSLITLGILLSLVLFIVTRKNKKQKEPTQELPALKPDPVIDLSSLAQHLQISRWVSSLLLQKGRTGEDLNYIKILQQSEDQTRKQYFTIREDLEIDEDRIIRRLKNIRIQLIGSNPSEMMLLKDSLKRMIRLTEILISENLTADTLNTEADVFIIIEPHPALINRHQLPELIKSKLITIGFTQGNTLVKPFSLVEIIDELIKRYTFTDTNQDSILAGVQDAYLSSASSKHLMNRIIEARASNNKEELFGSLHQLREATSGNETLHKWIDKLIQDFEHMNSLQIDLTIRNIITYAKKQSG